MTAYSADDFYIEGMVCLAMSKTPGVLDHAPRKTKRRVLVNRVIYAQLLERVMTARAGRAGKAG